MKSTTIRVQSLFFVIQLAVLFMGFSSCKNDSEEPEPVTNSVIGKYAGKMITTGGLTNQGSAITQTMVISVELTAGSKENEFMWKIIGPFGDYNDLIVATLNGTTFTTPKQKLTYGPGDEVTFEGTGTLIGLQLTVTLKEDDGGGQYTHEITVTKK